MPDIREASDGYVPPPRTGPNPFKVVDLNVIARKSQSPLTGSTTQDNRQISRKDPKSSRLRPMAQAFGL